MIRLWPFGRREPAIAEEILTWAEEVWPAEARRLPFSGSLAWILRDEGHRWRAALEESLRRLEARWSPAELGVLAAEPYFNPFPWQERLSQQAHLIPVVVTVLGAGVVRYPPPDIDARLEARLRAIFADPYAPVTPHLQVQRGENRFISQPPPTLEDYLALLTLLEPTPAVLDVIERLVAGDLDAPVNGPPPHGIGRGAPTGYAVHLSPLNQHVPALMKRLFEHGRLRYEVFARAAHSMPFAIGNLSERAHPRRPAPQAEPSPFLLTVRDYSARLAWDLAQDLSQDNCYLLKQMRGLRGNHYLVQAARLHDRLRLGRLVWKDYHFHDGLESGIVHLAAAAVEPASAEEHDQLVADLRQIRPQTLKALLPIAWRARAPILDALGWSHALPLVEQVLATAGLESAGPFEQADVRSSPDPTDGVLDVPSVRAALAQAGDETARQVLALFGSAQVGARNAVRLIEALAGGERAWVEQGLAKRNQIAVKAFGLLPLERGAEEVAERYLFLRAFAREARSFGPQRQASEQAAAHVALANLAQNAGYPDVVRLEWAMEARLGSAVAQPGETRSIEGYEVEIALDGFRPEIRVRREGRALKSVPQAVRKSPAYAELADTVKQMRDQAARLRATLEQMMGDGATLTAEDIGGIQRLPLGRAMLASLVLLDAAGTLGMLADDGAALVALDGERLPIRPPLRIAHPYDLYQVGSLGEWQRAIVRRRIVQPFAQVFRELYLLTPAERETSPRSRRFAGQPLDAAVASRLLQARGWELGQDEVALPRKRLPSAGLIAVFAFPDAGHFLAEHPAVTSGDIWFEPSRGAGRDPVPLADVPPRVFSEVMRDADLVVSVAQRDGAVRLSPEGYQRRGELVQTLLAELGLPNVTVDGHFARIQGRRADYRVHLGSGAIHIEPGNHLCIVPASWGTNADGLFLPFADEGDRQVSIVLSKILLLARDDQITDPTILAQIQRVRQG